MKKILKVLLVIILTILVLYLANSGFKYIVMKNTINTIWEIAESKNIKASIGNLDILANENVIILDAIDEFSYVIKQEDKIYLVDTSANEYYEVSRGYEYLEKTDNKEVLKEVLTLKIIGELVVEDGKTQEEIYNDEIIKLVFNPRYQITFDYDGNYIFCINNNVLQVDKENFKIFYVNGKNIDYYEYDTDYILNNLKIENLAGYNLIEEDLSEYQHIEDEV